MNGYSADGIGGVSNNYSSFVPSHRVTKNLDKTNGCVSGPGKRAAAIRIQNLQKPICCAPHNDWADCLKWVQGMNPTLGIIRPSTQASSVTAIGFGAAP
jgi:hypothetical protein